MRAVTGISFPHPVADGDQIAEFGDWVVHIGDGNFRVWNDDRFQEAYEAVVERDDTAELVEALEAKQRELDRATRLLAVIVLASGGRLLAPRVALEEDIPVTIEVQQDGSVEVRAALAAYEASRK